MRTLLLLTLLLATPVAGAATTATTLPAQPLVERGRTDQRLNFDLLFDNDGDRALELTGLEVTLLDLRCATACATTARAGRLRSRRNRS